MLINMRDNENNLRIKDILDVDFDMYVEKEDNKFYVRVNRLYQLDEVFEKSNHGEARETSFLKKGRMRNFGCG